MEWQGPSTGGIQAVRKVSPAVARDGCPKWMTKVVVPRAHPSLKLHVINAVTHQSSFQVPEWRTALVYGALKALRFCWLINLFGYLQKKECDSWRWRYRNEMVFSISTKNCVWEVKSRELWD